jgi:hypothetical protein
VATYIEIAIMIERALWCGPSQPRQWYADAILNKVLRGKDVIIWNGLNPNEDATDIEIAIMLTRAILRDNTFNWTNWTLKRLDIATAIGRDFLS